MSLQDIPKEYLPEKQGLTLYTFPAPNCVKVSVTLNLLGVPFAIRKLNIFKNEHQQEWYAKINPTKTIPALVDANAGPGSDTYMCVWETGAIMQYLALKYDQGLHKVSFPMGSMEHTQQTVWLFFQTSSAGAIQLQANRSILFKSEESKEQREFLTKKYAAETRRMYAVFERHLRNTPTPSGFLVGNHISIADIANIGWVTLAFMIGIDVHKEFPYLAQWAELVIAAPGVADGMNCPGPWIGFTKGPWRTGSRGSTSGGGKTPAL